MRCSLHEGIQVSTAADTSVNAIGRLPSRSWALVQNIERRRESELPKAKANVENHRPHAITSPLRTSLPVFLIFSKTVS